MSRTDVYFNLHKKVFSLKDLRTGRVYDHARAVVSSLPVDLVVRPAGHARALKEKQKNVHAFVRGAFIEPMDDAGTWAALVTEQGWTKISYNPYRGPSFYRKDTGQDIATAKAVLMLAPEGVPYPTVWAQL